MISILRWHAKQHPSLQPQDVLKLCYQSAFGAEHLLRDPSFAARMLENELDGCSARAEEALIEPLSEVSCRVNLRAWKARGLNGEWLFRMFMQSACPASNGEERFYAALTCVDRLCADRELSFSTHLWQQAKADYLRIGLHAVHHSDAYREAEAPAYRLVSLRMARLLPLLEQVKPPCVVALDGRAASGKTILAADFAAVTGAGIVHMDDFFLPPELRTEKRLQTAGGNVHYERFLTEVLPHLRCREDFAYSRFDCSAMQQKGQRYVKGADIYLVEGAYACHPALGEYMDIRAFCSVDAQEQRARIRARNGEAELQRYLQRWIPMEERYIRAFEIDQKASVLL